MKQGIAMLLAKMIAIIKLRYDALHMKQKLYLVKLISPGY